MSATIHDLAGVIIRSPDMGECTHDGIHGPDSEPGAVQRCFEETVLLRAAASPEGKAMDAAYEALQDARTAMELRIIRETLRHAKHVGEPSTVVVEPEDDYGRTKPWDPEGIED